MPVIFKNQGIIDLLCVTTMGVNVKPDTDSPIGYFGTGLKYAIAVLLRTGHRVILFRGLDRHDFTVATRTIRGKEFGIICLDGQELGFTTELGKKWAVWQAYRELYCNVLDENGTASMWDCETDICEKDTTIFAVAGAEFEECHTSRSKFILDSEPDITLPGIEIRERPTDVIFYRRVAVGRLEHPALFTYNLLEHTDLTEDRTVKDSWYLPYQVGRTVQACSDPAVLRRILGAKPETFESSLNYETMWPVSEAFLDIVAELSKHDVCAVSPSALSVYRKKRGVVEEIKRRNDLSPVQQEQLTRAIKFSASVGFSVTDYEIFCAERLGDGALGLAKDNKIYVSVEAFEQGTKIVAGTLIEEFIHLREKHKDCTRAMQNYLLNKLVSLGEELAGTPL